MYRSGVFSGSIIVAFSSLCGCQSHPDVTAVAPQPVSFSTQPLDEQYASTGIVLPASSRIEIQPVRQVTTADVVAWTRRGWSDEQIIDRLDHSDAIFHLGTADELRLLDAGVSDEVVRAMKASASR